MPTPALEAFEQKLRSLLDAGAKAFELPVLASGGPRCTLVPGDEPGRVLDALDVPSHPWGSPSWIGLRLGPGGEVGAKLYHPTRVVPEEALPATPRSLARFEPRLASSWMDAGVRCTEVYFRQRGHLVWPQVLEAVQELIGAAPCCSFVPKSRDGGLGISVRWRAGELVGASAVAREATLPPDFELQRRWLSTLSSDDAAVFTRACQSVAALGVPAGRHFLGVAWTLLSSGRQTQAAYFRVPPRLESIPC